VTLRSAPFYNVTRKVKSVESLKLPKFKLEKVKIHTYIIQKYIFYVDDIYLIIFKIINNNLNLTEFSR